MIRPATKKPTTATLDQSDSDRQGTIATVDSNDDASLEEDRSSFNLGDEPAGSRKGTATTGSKGKR